MQKQLRKYKKCLMNHNERRGPPQVRLVFLMQHWAEPMELRPVAGADGEAAGFVQFETAVAADKTLAEFFFAVQVRRSCFLLYALLCVLICTRSRCWCSVPGNCCCRCVRPPATAAAEASAAVAPPPVLLFRVLSALCVPSTWLLSGHLRLGFS